MTTYYDTIDSPIGTIAITSNGEELTGIYMELQGQGGPGGTGGTVKPGWILDPKSAPLPEAERQLKAYFAGELKEFDLPMAPQGTDFQLKVWNELSKIPYGVTISYGELAERIGNRNASRAVGLANGKNPISIVVPCHRVIGASGKLVGYGGGLQNKAWLLAHEALNARG